MIQGVQGHKTQSRQEAGCHENRGQQTIQQRATAKWRCNTNLQGQHKKALESLRVLGATLDVLLGVLGAVLDAVSGVLDGTLGILVGILGLVAKVLYIKFGQGGGDR